MYLVLCDGPTQDMSPPDPEEYDYHEADCQICLESTPMVGEEPEDDIYLIFKDRVEEYGGDIDYLICSICGEKLFHNSFHINDYYYYPYSNELMDCFPFDMSEMTEKRIAFNRYLTEYHIKPAIEKANQLREQEEREAKKEKAAF